MADALGVGEADVGLAGALGGGEADVGLAGTLCGKDGEAGGGPDCPPELSDSPVGLSAESSAAGDRPLAADVS